MAKRRITQTMPHDSPWNLVFLCQKSNRNSNGVIPNGGAKCGWSSLKAATFDEITRYNLKTVQDRCTVCIKVE